MKSIRTLLVVFAGLSAAAVLCSQEAKSNPGITGKEPATAAPNLSAGTRAAGTIVPPDEAYPIISKLNNEGLLVAPLFGKMRLTDLKPADCFGAAWSDGTRLIGQSSGRDYGLEFNYSGEPPQTNIAILYAEKPMQVGGKTLAAGPYFVFVSPQVATLFTEKRVGGKPVSSSVKLDLAAELAAASLERKAPNRPRVGIRIVEDQAILEIGANKFELRVAESK